MSKPVLSDTLKSQDVINIGLCNFIHNIVNGSVFEDTPGTEFADAINLRSKNLKVKHRKQIHALYVIHSLSDTIRPRSHVDEWITKILKYTDIKPEYYEKHKMDFYKEDTPDKNRKFKTSIDKAIEYWHRVLRDIPFSF